MPQSMFLSRNKKNNVYPCKPQFYYIKVGFKGVKIIQACFRDVQSTLVISASHMSDNRLSRSKNLVPQHGNLTVRTKILWKKEIARKQFLLFSIIFSIYLYLQESNYRFTCDTCFFDLLFLQFCNSDMSRYGYLEFFQRVPWT